MNPLTDHIRFIKAVEYASKRFFSKPYSLTPQVDRWFNQLAIIELENGTLIPISGNEARKYVDIKLDGVVIKKEDIELVQFYYSNKSKAEEKRAEIERILDEANASGEQTLESAAKIEKCKEGLAKHDRDKIKAERLYDDIVARGESSINREQIEQDTKSKIKNIVYRPNHGLTHSVRAAYYVDALETFYRKLKNHVPRTPEDIEKLKLMMLFSVVGRRDETGFNDTGHGNNSGRKTYESFRVASARAYLEFLKNNSQDLYPQPESLDAQYRDAIVVELMGYSSIEDAIERGAKPETFIDYVIEKEKTKNKTISREDAIRLISNKKYSLAGLYPNDRKLRQKANANLDMMNHAHGLDLSRCYPLYAQKPDGASSVGNIKYFLSRAGFYKFEDPSFPDGEKLTDCFQLMRYNFDALAATGQQSMFGLLSSEEFEAQKDSILDEVKTNLTRFQDADYETQRREATAARNAEFTTTGLNFTSINLGDNLIDDYKKHLITKTITERLTRSKALTSRNVMFNFQNVTGDNLDEIDHQQNALSLVNTLQQITPTVGATPLSLPIVSTVKHDREHSETRLGFDTLEQADSFQNTYFLMFGSKPDIKQNAKMEYEVTVDRKHYKKLMSAQLIEFKLVTIPEKVSREESLVDEHGEIEALSLIKESRGLTRLVSTTALSGEDFPDYEYLFRALDDPMHVRFVHGLKDEAGFKVKRDKYHHPRDGKIYSRKEKSIVPLQFQEPVTEPSRFDEKVEDGLSFRTVRNAAKNTIFTKKMAHSLLPPHGKVVPFKGYVHTMSNYFPIGVLSDIKQVDIRDERYVWSSNRKSVSCHNRRVSACQGARTNPSRARKQAEFLKKTQNI